MDVNAAWKAFSTHPNRHRYGDLSDARSKSLFVDVCHAILQRLRGFEIARFYTSDDICGTELWAQYGLDGQHRRIGILVSALVALRLIPFHCINLKASNKLYVFVPEWCELGENGVCAVT